MKIFFSSLVRAVVAAIVGMLILEYREDTVRWITVASGVLFFVSGIISCAIYYSGKQKAEGQKVYDAEGNLVSAGLSPNFPLVGLGSIILGIILAVMPVSFITGVMYAMAAILILGAINQFVNLGRATRFCRVGFFYWLLPSVILLVALFLIFKPIEMATTPLLLTGWCMLLYAATEIVNGLKLVAANHERKIMEKEKEVVVQKEEQLPAPSDDSAS
ncbi:MAG: DUF308 domain-containing protein [Prevotella sp.]|nr:DUF308 domain-containing protein [Prevotella sp.]